ncbi:MAG TPA: polysaccharide biosynthesis/export family protein [Acidobacteriota bacterium]|nr:polysaccharide biosynthesis/export family protein [Acidobacteriota bacterium]
MSKSAGVTFGLMFLAVSMVTSLFAQMNEEPQRLPPNYSGELRTDQREGDFLRLPGLSRDYRLGPGDRLQIEVVGAGPFSGFQSVRISNEGDINLAYVGLVKAADLTAAELEARIARALKEKKLLKDPEVLVFIEEYRHKPIYVLGDVDVPGEYIMTQDLYLMDAILMAGGLDYTSADTAYLHRRKPGAPPPTEAELSQDPTGQKLKDVVEVIEVDLLPMKQGEMLKTNPLMRAGDVLFVPERKVDYYYVIGDVLRAGIFEIPQKGELLASRAIAYGGGPTRTAKMSDGLLVRYDEQGNRKEIPVDFAAILDGRQPDFPIQPNDIIFIPGSTAKNVGYGMLGIIPSLLTKTIIPR